MTSGCSTGSMRAQYGRAFESEILNRSGTIRFIVVLRIVLIDTIPQKNHSLKLRKQVFFTNLGLLEC